MSGLDSIYAMLAQPVKAVLHPKRVVDQVSSATANAPDSHETPQSQLPPTLEGRDAKVRERRKDADNNITATIIKKNLENKQTNENILLENIKNFWNRRFAIKVT